VYPSFTNLSFICRSLPAPPSLFALSSSWKLQKKYCFRFCESSTCTCTCNCSNLYSNQIFYITIFWGMLTKPGLNWVRFLKIKKNCPKFSFNSQIDKTWAVIWKVKNFDTKQKLLAENHLRNVWFKIKLIFLQCRWTTLNIYMSTVASDAGHLSVMRIYNFWVTLLIMLNELIPVV